MKKYVVYFAELVFLLWLDAKKTMLIPIPQESIIADVSIFRSNRITHFKLIMKSFITGVFMVLLSQFGQTQQLYNYTSFQNESLQLYGWEGKNVILLSESNQLSSTKMNHWLSALDGAYDYYQLCTGREPQYHTQSTCINGKNSIAQVPNTCGAGCGYVGFKGIELLSNYFDSFYNQIEDGFRSYDQTPFYELGRNFWFYENKLAYQDGPTVTTTGYAIFMRFMAMEKGNLSGAPFGNLTFLQFKQETINLFDLYMADSSLNWQNSIATGQGVPNAFGGRSDLFASFCFKLREMYGNCWVENVWKFAGDRPVALSTQEAVDNFIVASSQAAGENLADLFEYWKWPVSTKARNTLSTLNLKGNEAV